jgi:hypothetical protein
MSQKILDDDVKKCEDFANELKSKVGKRKYLDISDELSETSKFQDFAKCKANMDRTTPRS